MISTDLGCATVADICGEGLSYFRGTCYNSTSTECGAGEIETGSGQCLNPCPEEETFINGDCYNKDGP